MRSRPLIALGAVSAAVIAAAVVVLWVMGSSGGERKPFSTLSMAPRDVDFYLAMNTDPASAQWITFARLLDSVKTQTVLRSAWDRLLTQQGLSWDKDVVSLLDGEAYIAITDFSALGDGKGLVGAIRLRDTKKAEKTFLQLVKSAADDAGDKVLEEKYQGVTITYVQHEEFSGRSRTLSDSGAIAFTGTEAVLGLSRADVKGVIDVIQGRAPSIGANPRFQEMRARQQDDFLLWGYVDLAAAWDLVGDYVDENAATTPETQSALTELRDAADRLTFSFSARKQGFVIDVAMTGSPDAAKDASKKASAPFEPALAKQVPEGTIFFAGGPNVYDQIFLPIRNAADKNADLDSSLKQFERDVGFKLDGDLFGLMKGEYGFAADYSASGPSDTGVSLVGLINVQDATRVARSLDLLGRYLNRETELYVSGPDRSGVRRVSDSSISSDAFAWTTAGKTVVAGYPEDAVQSFGKVSRGKSLADSKDWKQVMALLPSEKSFVAYLSIARILEEARDAADLDTALADATDGDIKFDDLRPIRALGISGSTVSDGYKLRIVLLLAEP